MDGSPRKGRLSSRAAGVGKQLSVVSASRQVRVEGRHASDEKWNAQWVGGGGRSMTSGGGGRWCRRLDGSHAILVSLVNTTVKRVVSPAKSGLDDGPCATGGHTYGKVWPNGPLRDLVAPHPEASRSFQKLPKSFPEAPRRFQKLPRNSQKLPEASQNRSFQKLPRSSQKLPGTSRNLPETSQKLPRSFPEASQNLPRSFQKIPRSSQKLPETSQKLPTSFPETPRSSQKLPKATRSFQKLPVLILSLIETEEILLWLPWPLQWSFLIQFLIKCNRKSSSGSLDSSSASFLLYS